MLMNRLLIISIILLFLYFQNPTDENEFYKDVLEIQFEDNVTFSHVLNFSLNENISIIKIKLMHYQYYLGFFRISEKRIGDFYEAHEGKYPVKSVSYVLISDERLVNEVII